MTNEARKRLVTFSSRMSVATGLAMIILGAALAWILIQIAYNHEWLVNYLAGRFDRKILFLSPARTSLIVIIILVQAGFLFHALNTLRLALSAIANSGGIATEAARLIRLSGFSFAMAAAAMVVSGAIVSALYSLGAPAGQRFITIELETGHLMMLVLSGILVTFGHLVALAAEIDNENRQIV